MHPATLILIWMTAVGLLQTLERLPLLVVVVLLASIAAFYAPQRARRLVRRVRFLLLAIVLFFVGFTPGEAVITDLPRLSPSREGLELAFEHAGRLIAVVLGVAVLLQRLPPEQLIAGFLALLKPLESIGFPAERVAVRTLLVLDLVESSAPRQWRAWVHDQADTLPPPIRIMDVRLRRIDRITLMVLLVCVCGVVWVVNQA